MSWGIKAPEGVKASWGARAIFDKYGPGLGLVSDRQGMEGESTAKAELAAWLNTRGLKGLKKVLKESFIDHSDNKEIRYEDEEFVIVANPRASYGYLYIGAWKEGANG